MFENIISLGSDCLVASALGKYGLRSASGPFDWCTSDFMRGVIPHIENNFAEFMLYENLEISYKGDNIFDDIKYKINYNHDVVSTLAEDYTLIIEKYSRRIEVFRAMLKKPTCFVRGCWGMEELSAIVENEERIKKALKLDDGNELIIVVPRFIFNQKPIKTSFKMFIVETNISGFALGREESRSFFDTNKELVDFLISNYPEDKRKDNLIFDLQAELTVAKKQRNIDNVVSSYKKIIINQNEANVALSTRLSLWMMIENTDYATIKYTKNAVIYGCGAIGRILSKKIREYVKIAEFLDREPRQDYYEGIPVNKIGQSELEYDENTTIIVVPSYDFESIVKTLRETYGNDVVIIKLQEWLSVGKIIDPNF